MFELLEQRQLMSNVLLTGTPFGTNPNLGVGQEFEKAFDGNINTHFQSATANGAVIGQDFGQGNAWSVNRLRFRPVGNFGPAMVGGKIQVSTDNTNWTDVHTITTAPPNAWTEVVLATPSSPARYARYAGPNGSYARIAELEFYTDVPDDAPAAPSNLIATASSTGAHLTWQDNSNNETGFRVERKFGALGTWQERTTLAHGTTTFVDTGLPAGQPVFYRLRANSDAADFSYSNEVGVTTAGTHVKLSGSIIAATPTTAGAAANAFDGNVNSGYVSQSNTGAGYIGLDLGAGNGKSLSKVRFHPSNGFEHRIVGGRLQGSNDGTNYTDLHTVSTMPARGWNELYFTTGTSAGTSSYRYYRFKGPNTTYTTIAELEFYTLQPVTVSVLGPTSSPEGTAVTFVSDVSYSGPGVLSYAWTVSKTGDASYTLPAGTVTNAPSLLFTPPDNGSYVVNLTVTPGQGGGGGTASATLAVSNVSPRLVFAGPEVVYQGDAFKLRLDPADPGADTIQSWVVNWGDGSPETSAAGNVRELFHTYPTQPGTYSVTVTAVDEDGTHAMAPVQVTVIETPPVLTISGESVVAAGATYTLGLSAEDPGGVTVSSWIINWGDGNIQSVAGNPETVTHVYSAVGDWVISASATDANDTYVVGSLPVTVVLPSPAPIHLRGSAVGGSRVNLEWNRHTEPGARVVLEQSDDGLTYRPIATVPADQGGYSVEGLQGTGPFRFRAMLIDSVTPGMSNEVIVSLASGDVAYFSDFEGAIGDEWSNRRRSVTPNPDSGRRFLGEFGDEKVTLRLGNLPAHGALLVSFDLYVIRSWDGSDVLKQWGPDRWRMSVDGQTQVDTTFSNHGWASFNAANDTQHYPGASGDPNLYPAFAGSAEHNTLGYYFALGKGTNPRPGRTPMDSVYRLEIVVQHGAAEVELDFEGLGLQPLGDESWGLDNVRVVAMANPTIPLSAHDLEATPVSSTEIRLDWQDVADNETGYRIELSTNGVDYAPVGTVAAGSDSYLVPGLTPASEYYFRVVAYNEAGDSVNNPTVRSETPGSLMVTILNAPEETTEGSSTTLEAALGGLGLSGEGVNYTWTVMKVGQVDPYAQGNDSLFNFRPDDNGTYTIRIDVTDQVSGETARDERSVLVKNVAPAVEITGGVVSLTEGTVIRLHANVTDPSTKDTAEGFFVSWTVKKGDEVFVTGTGVNIEFTPDDAAAYTVIVVAMDKDSALTTPPAELVVNVVPNAPSQVRPRTVSGSTIHLTWADNSSVEDGFTIEARPLGGAWQTLGTAPIDQTYFIANTLQPGTSYDFRVSAYGSAIPTAVSPIANAYTQPDAPDAPVVIDQTNTSVTLSIGLAANPSATFMLEWRAADEATWGERHVARSVPPGTGQVTIGNLRPNTTYYFRAKAVAGGNTSTYSGLATALTTAVLPSAPTSPQASTSSANPGAVTLTWIDNANNETQFEVAYSLNGMEWLFLQSPAYVTGAGPKAEVTGLLPGQAYQLRVRAVNQAGKSGWTEIVSASASLLAAPSGLNVTASTNKTVSLSWSYSGTQQSGFTIEHRRAGESEFRAAGFVQASARDTTITGLRFGTDYTFRIRAYSGAPSSAAQSAHSAEVVGTTTAIAPVAPVGATLTATLNAVEPGRIDLSWADFGSVEDHYRIEYSHNGVDWVFYDSQTNVAQVNWTYGRTANNLRVASPYHFRLIAWNEVGEAAPVESTTLTTRAFLAPTALRLAAPPQQPVDPNTSVRLEWTSATADATGYFIDQKGPGDTEFRQIGSAGGANTTNYLVGGLVAGQNYDFRVRAFYGPWYPWLPPTYISLPSDTLTHATASNLPAAPTSLQAHPETAGVRLTWSDQANNEASFEVEYTSVANPVDQDFTQITTLPANTASYTIDGLDPALTYTFRVRAVNTAGNSAWTTPYASAQPDPISTQDPEVADPGVAPTAPMIATISAMSPGRIDISLIDSVTNPRRGYRIEISASASGDNFTPYATVGMSLEHSLVGLNPSTTYRVRVRAFNGAGESAPSVEASATTMPFAAPTNLSAVATASRQIALDWSDNTFASTSETGFVVEQSNDGGRTFVQVARTSRNVRAYLIENLVANAEYHFRVRATGLDSTPTASAEYVSEPSNTVSARPIEMLPPQPVSGLVAIPLSATEMQLTWVDNTPNVDSPTNEDGYRILIWENWADVPDYAGPGLPGTPIIASDVTSFVLRNLKPATTYQFRVEAYSILDPIGFRSYDIVAQQNSILRAGVSNLVEAKTRPTTPVGLTATVTGADRVDLAWSASFGATSYDVQRSSDGETWSDLASGLTGASAYADIGISARYLYRVRAVGTDGGASPWTVAAQAALPTPTGLIATTVSTSRIDIAWQPLANAIGYQLRRSVNSAGPWVTIATFNNPADTTYSDTALNDGTSYGYQLVGIHPLGDSRLVQRAGWTRLAAPTVTSVKFISGARVELTWARGSAAGTSSFAIQYRQGAGNWSNILSVSGSSTHATLDGLFSPSSNYVFRIKASNGVPVADSEFSPEVAVTSGDFPDYPTDLTASSVGTTSLTLNWTDHADDEQGFRIERRIPGQTWAVVGVTASNLTTFHDADVREGTRYEYRVSAYNAAGGSGFTTTSADTKLVTPIIRRIRVISGREMQIEIADGSTFGRYYQLFDAATSQLLQSQYATNGGGATITLARNFEPSSSHSFYVIASPAQAAGRASDASAAASVLTPAFPKAASNATITPLSATSIRLDWTDNATDEAGFYVERQLSMGAWQRIGKVGAGDTSYIATGLADNATYRYRVAAFNAVGESYFAESASYQPPPAAPSGVVLATLQGNRVDLRWADRSFSESEFRVEYRNGEGAWLLLGKVAANATRLLVRGSFDPLTEYSFRVQAVRGAGGPGQVSDYSAPFTVVSGNWPHAPTNLVATPIPTSQRRVELTWSDSPDDHGYAVYRRRSGQDWALLGTTGTGVTTFTDAEARPSYFWSYVVAALGADGSESGFSNEQTVQTRYDDPHAPTSLAVAADSNSSITLTWQQPATLTDETGFVIERSLQGASWLRMGQSAAFRVVAVVAADQTSFTDSDLLPATTYFYRVRAIRSDGVRQVTLPNNSQVTVGEGTAIGYAITQFADDIGAASLAGGPMLLMAASATPGGEDPGDPPSDPPAGYPFGRPDDGTNSPKVYRVKINAAAERDWGQPTDPAGAPDGTVRGKIRFKAGWVQASSPQAAIAAALEENSAQIKVDGNWMSVPIMHPDFFNLDTLDWNGGGTYVSHLSGDHPIAGYWNRSCMNITVDVPWAEADVDSNNDGLPPTPAAADAEDKDEAKEGKPGQFVPVNDGDADEDDIPGWADGIDRFQAEGDDGKLNDKGKLTGDEFDNYSSGEQFVPITLTLAPTIKLPAKFDTAGNPLNADDTPYTENVKVKFDYEASDPEEITREGEGTQAKPYIYKLPAQGRIRLWTVVRAGTGALPHTSSEQAKPDRNRASWDQEGGHFIKPGVAIDAWKLFGLGHSATVYVEGVKQSTAAGQEQVKFLVNPGPGADGFAVSDVVRLTAIRLDADLDSDNTSADLPERDESTTPLEDQLEASKTRPGKILVVSAGDSDRDQAPDFADGLNTLGAAGASHHKLVPLVIQIPETVDPTKIRLRINYRASNPSKAAAVVDTGDHRAYKLGDDGEGFIRLWLKDGTVVRNTASARQGPGGGNRGHWMEPGIYKEEDVAHLGLNASTRQITVYVEAVRPTPANDPAAGIITVEIDPHFIVPEVAEQWLVVDKVRFTAVDAFAPEAHEAPVRADGVLQYASVDVDGGYGVPFGQARFFSTGGAETLLTGIAGKGFGASAWPRLIQATSSVMASVGGVTYVFDKVGADYKPRFGGREKLVPGAGTADWGLFEPDGTMWTFTGFNPAKPEWARGQFKAMTEPGGLVATATVDDKDRIATITRDKTTYTFDYFEKEENEEFQNLLQTVTIDVVAEGVRGAGQWQVTYDYYKKPAEGAPANKGGNSRDLKSVVVKHNGTESEKKFYRYQVKPEGQESTPSRLMMAIEGRDAVRIPAGLNVETAEDAALTEYASLTVAYDEQGRVQSLKVRGDGASDTGNKSAVGTYGYAYADRADKPSGMNAWRYKLTTNLPSGAKEDLYTNHGGQTLVSAVAADGVYTTFYKRDAKGRVLETYTPSAADGAPDETTPALAKVKTDAGLVYHAKYFQTGALEGELEELSIKRGANDETPVRQQTFTYVGRTVDGYTVNVPETVKVYVNDDGTGALTTSYNVTAWNRFVPANVVTTMPATPESGGNNTATQAYDAQGRPTTFTDEDGYVHEQRFDAFSGGLLLDERRGDGKTRTTRVTVMDDLGRPKTVVDARSKTATYDYADTFSTRTITAALPGGVQTEDVENLVSGVVEHKALTPSSGLQVVGRDTLDHAGRLVGSERLSGTETYTTSYKYDAGGRRSTTINAANTEYVTEFDKLGRAKEDRINGTVVRTYEYDKGGVGNGNLTKLVEKPGAGAGDRTTEYFYDWRDRQWGTRDGTTVVHLTLDNLSRETSRAINDRTLTTISDASGEVEVDAGTGMRSLTDFELDARGRAHEVIIYAVDPQTGSTGGTLTTTLKYDGRGNVVKAVEPGGRVTRQVFDAAGRRTLLSVGGESTVVESVETEYDGNGNTIFETTRRLQPDGAIYREGSVAHWYDEANRLTDSVDYGTGSPSSRPDSAPAASTDTALLTHYGYDAGGFLEKITDPKGILTELNNDALGRVVRRYDNRVPGSTAIDANRLTSFSYNGLDQLTLTNVINRVPGGDVQSQSTAYTYGTNEGEPGSAINSKDLLGRITYPGGSQEKFSYNALGEVIKKRDRNTVLHTYTLDGNGRVLSDSVSNLPSEVFDYIDNHTFEYDVLGRLKYAATKSEGNGVHVVSREYNGFGQLLKEVQSRVGGLSGTVEYGYTFSATENHSRMSSVKYPDGRVVDYGYNTGLDNEISRVSHVGQGSVHFEEYSYLGLDRIMWRTRPGANIVGVTFLDSLGRTNAVEWLKAGTTFDEHRYTHDRNGNVTSRTIPDRADLSETYQYNNLNVRTDFTRGSSTTTWSVDTQGNRQTTGRTYNSQNQIEESGYTNDSLGNSSTVRTRDGESFKLLFDAWGNVTEATVHGPDGVILRASMYDYDALGRRVLTSGYTKPPAGAEPFSVPFEDRILYYDSSGHVLQEEKVLSGGSIRMATQAQYVWSPDGQIVLRDWNTDNNDADGLEERLWVQQDGAGSVTSIVNGATGNVVERYTYGPFGLAEVRNNDWSVYVPPQPWKLTKRWDWVYLYQGMRLDPLAVVYHAQDGTDYDPVEGRTLQPDLTKFSPGWNPYDPKIENYTSSFPTWWLDAGDAAQPIIRGAAFVGAFIPIPVVQLPSLFVLSTMGGADAYAAGESGGEVAWALGRDALLTAATFGVVKGGPSAMRWAFGNLTRGTVTASLMLATVPQTVEAGVWDTVLKRGMSLLRGGNRIVQQAGRTMHFAAGTSEGAIQRMLKRADPLGDALQGLTTKHAGAWSPAILSQAESAAISRAHAAGKHWLGHLLRQQAKGRYVHEMVRRDIDALRSAGHPLFARIKYNHRGIDVVAGRRTYDIMSLTNQNVRDHAVRMSGMNYRIIGFK